jgi:hypothetical protein
LIILMLPTSSFCIIFFFLFHLFSVLKVSVGDCIHTIRGFEEVTAVETVWGRGLYTVVTKEVSYRYKSERTVV